MTGGYRGLSPLLLAVVLAVASGGWGASAARQATPAADCRVVAHELGEACVPLDPRRVVVLDRFPLDSALAVGVRPVGVPTLDNPSSYLAPPVVGIAENGTESEPNIEQIAALKPDLIIGSVAQLAEIGDKLSRLAPVVAIDDGDSGAWKRVHAQVADALGRADEGERVMAAYQARLDAFKARMGARLGETEVSVIRPRDGGIRLYGRTYFSGTVLEDAGLPRPPSQDVEEEEPLDISKELIGQADGDVIFVWSFSPEEREELAKIADDPLWAKLGAVRDGRVYEVGEHWYGGGPLAANAVLDDLFLHLLGEGA